MQEILRKRRRTGVDGWTEKHQKEEEFQRNKRVCRRLKAAEDNALLPEEMTADVVEGSRLQRLADMKRIKNYDSRKARLPETKTT